MATGQRTWLTDSNLRKPAVSELISMIDPSEVPLCAYLNFGAGTEGKFQLGDGFPNHKVEWIEDVLTDRADAVNSTVMTNSTTTTAFDVDDGGVFQPGHIIEVDSEFMWVSAVTSNTLTVTRGAWGSTQATHADDAAVTVVSTARLEGDTADDSHTTTVGRPFNYTQIFQRTIDVSRSLQRQAQYGVQDEYNRQVVKYVGGGDGMGGRGRAGVLPIELEKAMFRGGRTLRTAALGGSMGGLDWWLNTSNNAGANVTTLSNSPALTRKNVEDAIEDCWDDGGKPNLIVCGAWAKRKLTSFYEGAVRYERETPMGGMVIERILTEFGELDILLDRWCPTTKMYVLDTDFIGILPFDEFFEEEFTGNPADSKKGQVVGEYTFIVGHVNATESAHALISGFSTSK